MIRDAMISRTPNRIIPSTNAHKPIGNAAAIGTPLRKRILAHAIETQPATASAHMAECSAQSSRLAHERPNRVQMNRAANANNGLKINTMPMSECNQGWQ